jgi:hypothetical protein
MHLEMPDQADVRKARPSSLGALMDACAKRLSELATSDEAIDGDPEAQPDDFNKMVWIVGTVLDLAHYELIRRGNYNAPESLLALLRLARSNSSSREQFLAAKANNARVIIANHLVLLSGSMFAALMRPVPRALRLSELDVIVHENAVPVVELVAGTTDVALRDYASQILSHHLAFLAELCKPLPDQELPIGEQINELHLLATRHESVVKKYGAKRVEGQLERVLSLLVQSWGFYVATTSVGERRIDLICLSGDPRGQYSFLIEAKSSGKPYALPVADERAIGEYIHDVRRSLSTLPPLAFVLIVGGAAGPSLGTRLRRLEARHGIPVRFITGGALQRLDTMLPGPAPHGEFRDSIVAAEALVGNDVIGAIASRYKDLQDAHAMMIRTLLRTSTGPLGIAPSHASHEMARDEEGSSRNSRAGRSS